MDGVSAMAKLAGHCLSKTKLCIENHMIRMALNDYITQKCNGDPTSEQNPIKDIAKQYIASRRLQYTNIDMKHQGWESGPHM